jgi:hypothetical protein
MSYLVDLLIWAKKLSLYRLIIIKTEMVTPDTLLKTQLELVMLIM